ncbi:MAG: hypothetical protein M1819_003414 [Sarea resinae]|nr:MAG: hypothetical protein M1819_003414 [Sarea resinae]
MSNPALSPNFPSSPPQPTVSPSTPDPTHSSQLQESDQQHFSQNDQDQQQRAVFNPFFTLITDSTSQTHHHPTVHYLFSDDAFASDVVTAASLRALNPNPTAHPDLTPNVQHEPSDYPQDPQDPHSYPPPAQPPHDLLPVESILPPPANPDVPERYILLTLAPSSLASHEQQQQQQPEQPASTSSSYAAMPPPPAPLATTTAPTTTTPSLTIASAHSLSADWAILNAEITPAPTWSEAESEVADAHGGLGVGGLMLRIEGTEGVDLRGLEQEGEGEGVDMEMLVKNFGDRISELRRVVEAGDMSANVNVDADADAGNRSQEEEVLGSGGGGGDDIVTEKDGQETKGPRDDDRTTSPVQSQQQPQPQSLEHLQSQSQSRSQSQSQANAEDAS